MKISNIKFILFVSLIIYGFAANAGMPKTVCNSICAESKNLLLPKGAKCIAIDKKMTIYYRTLGSGFPTMIFASGTGFPSEGWYESNIASTLSNKVRVFTYDRIYTHNSCPNKNKYLPLTAQDVVNQLRQLLKQENINPPYILVGHSFGGLYMQLYAREYPNEVAGMLLMDAVTSNGPVILTEEEEDFIARHRLDHPQRPSPENPLYNEIIGQLPSYLQLRKAPPLSKEIPLIVMYATKECLPKIGDEKQLCMDEARIKEHIRQQIALYNSSNYHRLVRVDGEHTSFFDADKLQLLINELEFILKMSRERAIKLKNI